jgi:hypothetical protein
VDDLDLWAYHRDRVYEAGQHTIVLLGMSRIQLDWSMRTARERLPGYRVVQLAVAGRHPLAALRDLAQDERFTGIVVCGVNAVGLLRRTRERQQEYVDFYHQQWSTNRRLNGLIRWTLQDHLVLANPVVNLRSVLSRLLRLHGLPEPLYVVTHFDRSRSADFSMTDIASQRQKLVERLRRGYEVNPAPSPERWLKEARDVVPMVESIRSRGGKVAFAWLPTEGEHRVLDERYYPKREYWDQLADETDLTMIHFEDVPSLTGFECPDTSHIDQRDTDRFTNAFIDELIRREIIAPR